MSTDLQQEIELLLKIVKAARLCFEISQRSSEYRFVLGAILETISVICTELYAKFDYVYHDFGTEPTSENDAVALVGDFLELTEGVLKNALSDQTTMAVPVVCLGSRAFTYYSLLNGCDLFDP